MRLRRDLRELRIKEGRERNAAWAKLSPAEKLKSLDKRLGIGRGAERQRAKLAKAIDGQGKKAGAK